MQSGEQSKQSLKISFRDHSVTNEKPTTDIMYLLKNRRSHNAKISVQEYLRRLGFFNLNYFDKMKTLVDLAQDPAGAKLVADLAAAVVAHQYSLSNDDGLS